MDALTINGPKGITGPGMFNFSDPPSGLNFVDPPSFDSEFWSFPDVVPANEFAKMTVNFMGTTLRPANLLQQFFLSDNYEHGHQGAISYVTSEVYNFVVKEAELLTNAFNLPVNLWEGIPYPQYMSPAEYQQELDAFFNEDWVNEAYTAFYSVWDKINQSEGGIIFDDDISWLDLTPFTFVDGELVINPYFIFDLPFQIYGPGDANRFWLFFNNSHDMLSQAYGTNQSLGMFPYRPSKLDQFFSNLWSGIKKFFPGLIIARNAFLGLVALNVFDIANKMVEHGNTAQLKRTWEGFGGSWNALKNTINDGATSGSIGEPGTAAALITAATPILLAFMKLLDIGGNSIDEVFNAIASVTGEECNDYVTSMTEFVTSFNLTELASADLNQIFDTEFPDIPEECIEPVTDLLNEILPGDFQIELPGGPDEGEDDNGTDTPVLNSVSTIGTALAALYFLFGR
jgi:hypothetical protein